MAGSQALAGLGGAAAGAGVGAGLGSVVPGIGTVAGAIGGGVLGGVMGLFGGDDEEAKKAQALEAARVAMLQGISLPEFLQYRPELYQYIGDYTPEEIQYGVYKEDPNIRARQLASLEQMAGLAQTGLSDADQYDFMKAQRTGEGIAAQGRNAAMDRALARGVGASGIQRQMEAEAEQEGANRAQDAAMATAANAARQRALYQQMYGQQLGNFRTQEADIGQQAQDTINRFNTLNTQNRNEANLRNLNSRQSLQNQNVDIGNKAQLTNNDIKQQRFNLKLS